jgi:hypothetical protein
VKRVRIRDEDVNRREEGGEWSDGKWSEGGWNSEKRRGVGLGRKVAGEKSR